MPKPRAPPNAKVSIHYWQDFLRKKNLVGPIMEKTEETEAQTPAPIEPDMQTFIERVAERLTPLKGLDPQARIRALNIRQKIRQELTNVFLGKESFNKWYDRTRTNFALHNTTFIRILYECLEGLKSQECKNLRQEYENTLRAIQRIG